MARRRPSASPRDPALAPDVGRRAVDGRLDPHRTGPRRGWLQPRAGVLPAGLRELCDEHGILLIADEVQCGYGRTGKMWAFEHAGIVPDVVVVAKAIANGLPLSAIVSSRELQERWGRGAHGSTYGGNPVACAAGIAVLETMRDEGLVENAVARGAELVGGSGCGRGRGRPDRRHPRTWADGRCRIHADAGPARPAHGCLRRRGPPGPHLRTRPRDHPLDPTNRRHRSRDRRSRRDLRRDARVDAPLLSSGVRPPDAASRYLSANQTRIRRTLVDLVRDHARSFGSACRERTRRRDLDK